MNTTKQLNWTNSTGTQFAETNELAFSVSKSGRSWYLMTQFKTKRIDGDQTRFDTKHEAKANAQSDANGIFKSAVWNASKNR